MMAAARTARNTMAPTAAPQQMQHQYDAFPSPSSANFDHSPGAPQSFTQINTLNLAYYETFYNRLIVHISTIHGLEEKCSTLNQHFGYFQQQALDEIHRLKIETLLSQGLPTGKRRSDDTDGDYSSGSSPDTKKVKNERVDSCEADSPEEEVNVKGSWRCLYYEEDPETHFHCKEKRYKRVSELRRHIKTHTLPHYCAECGYRTAEERRLQNHKCEPGNRKKYSPVSEEDRLKHEQLARMGIKVGHMRMILFGKKGEADEFANGVDDGTFHRTHNYHR